MLLGSDADAHDVLQDVFTRLLHRPAMYKGHSSLLTWLYAVTTNACLNRIRNRHRRGHLTRVFGSNGGSSIPAAPDDATVLRDVLARLPNELGQVAVYYYADEMTHEEIASVMGCSRRHIGNLVGRLHRSLANMEGHDA
jgi:RNA polymerase sigma factor (sigma-70 family)